MVNYEDFTKIELKIGKIIEASTVEGSGKLLKLNVDLGEGDLRQIIAGIGKEYAPESLPGREIVVVANLVPRSLMGLESNGMLLAADGREGPILLMPDKDALPGTRIK